jgi:peptidoglycan hydrolase-like protein with peptidoglycan-binding domain
LRPGETRTLSLTLDTSRISAGAARNCASLDWSERTRIMAVQNALNELGFAVRPVDGRAASRTRNAIADYQKSIGQIATGQIDTALCAALRQLGRATPIRQTTTAARR